MFSFRYQRSIDPSLSIEDYDKPFLSVYPNPSASFLRVSGLNTAEPYRLYSILGIEFQSGIVSSDQEIDIGPLQTGMYMLQIANTALPYCEKVGFTASKILCYLNSNCIYFCFEFFA